MHCFSPELPPKHHSVMSWRKGGPLFCKTESPGWISDKHLHKLESKERQEDRVEKKRARW